jgi:hypothetical protein
VGTGSGWRYVEAEEEEGWLYAAEWRGKLAATGLNILFRGRSGKGKILPL